MEYIFGQTNTSETLKTVGHEHTDYKGIVTIVREYSDSTITDKFKTSGKYKSEDGKDGTCYDWYIVTEHSRQVDKSPAIFTRIDDVQNDVDDNRSGLIETFEMADLNSADISDLRDAVMEIYEILEG